MSSESSAPSSASTSGITPHSPPGKISSKRSSTGLRPIASRSAIVPKDLEAEKALRRNVTQGLIPRARRHFDPNRIEICLPTDFAPNAAASLQLTRQFLGETSGHNGNPGLLSTNNHFLPPSPTTLLGAGRVDPFAVYPVTMTSDIQSILDQCEYDHGLGNGF